MAGIGRFLKRIFGSSKRAAHPIGPDLSRFAEGDRVLIDGKKLTGPLQHKHSTNLQTGLLHYNDIIGESPRSYVSTHKGHKHQIMLPSLDEYISLTPRRVTPVYSSYASLIVSLLDIHVPAPTPTNENEPPLEILESGTGHGALTLHLARAVHAANPAPPKFPTPLRVQLAHLSEEFRQTWKAYLKSRRSVVHSVEISEVYSTHAEKLVHQFRSGIYAPHVDFHVSAVGSWIATQLKQSGHGAPFLSHVFLDMPGANLQLDMVASAMKDDALAIVFVPSVTQIAECVKTIEKNKTPLKLVKVLELGEGISNGRTWDVRLAKTRADKSVQTRDAEIPSQDAIDVEAEDSREAADVDIKQDTSQEDDLVMVCRPKVGRMTIGGGFIGLWRKVIRTA